jgi:hypothetical protein
VGTGDQKWLGARVQTGGESHAGHAEAEAASLAEVVGGAFRVSRVAGRGHHARLRVLQVGGVLLRPLYDAVVSILRARTQSQSSIEYEYLAKERRRVVVAVAVRHTHCCQCGRWGSTCGDSEAHDMKKKGMRQNVTAHPQSLHCFA